MPTATKVHEESVDAPVADAGANGERKASDLRSLIFAANDLQPEYVEVPEWGVTLQVRPLTGAERDAFDGENFKLQQQADGEASAAMSNFRARLVVRSVFDDSGNRVFLNKDAAELGRKSSAAIRRLYDVAQRLSGVSDEEVEQATEGLKGDQNASSGSG